MKRECYSLSFSLPNCMLKFVFEYWIPRFVILHLSYKGQSKDAIGKLLQKSHNQLLKRSYINWPSWWPERSDFTKIYRGQYHNATYEVSSKSHCWCFQRRTGDGSTLGFFSRTSFLWQNKSKFNGFMVTPLTWIPHKYQMDWSPCLLRHQISNIDNTDTTKCRSLCGHFLKDRNPSKECLYDFFCKAFVVNSLNLNTT